ncbi:MAG: hypothetical protein K6B68_14485 [Eubacterium sp.]|nr:hypothetical protein [Eubacterium sp.]
MDFKYELYPSRSDDNIIDLSENIHRVQGDETIMNSLWIINTLCFIHRGSSISICFPKGYYVRYSLLSFFSKYYNPILDSIKLKSASDYFSRYSFPKEFELCLDLNEDQLPRDVDKKDVLKYTYDDGDRVYYALADYKIIVPQSYSLKQYNDLKEKFSKHKQLISEMVSFSLPDVVEGDYYSVYVARKGYTIKKGINTREEKSFSFESFGMGGLSGLSQMVAFSEEFILCCDEIFKLRYPTTNIIIDCYSTSSFCKNDEDHDIYGIKFSIPIYKNEPVKPKPQLASW